MEEQNKKSLKEYFRLCIVFDEDPSEENQDALDDYLSDLQIKEYLTLREKAVIAMTIMREVKDDFDALGSANFIELGKVFHGLCAYVVNLENDIFPLNQSFAAYDLTMQYGLVDKILEYCKDDYDRLCQYIDNTMNMSNVYRLIQTAGLFNDAEYEKWIASMNEIKSALTPEFMKAIEEINISHSDVTKDLMSILAEQAVKNNEKILKQDKEKYSKIAEALDEYAGQKPIFINKEEQVETVEENTKIEEDDLKS